MRMSDWSSDVCSSDLSTPQAIDALHRSGVRVVMLTGDSKATARAVAEQLGIDEAIGEVLPEDKSAVVKRFQAEGRTVDMAGYGVNDAHTLAAGNGGIGMGTVTELGSVWVMGRGGKY